MIAVVGVDPGVTTGLAWAVVDERLGAGRGIVEALAAGRTEAVEVTGPDEVVAVRAIMDVLTVWDTRCWVELGVVGLELVCIESFILRTRVRSPVALSPARVGFGVELALTYQPWWGGEVAWASASDAKGVINDARLRRAGLWVPGKPHARDAWRHLALGLRRRLGG